MQPWNLKNILYINLFYHFIMILYNILYFWHTSKVSRGLDVEYIEKYEFGNPN